MGDLKRFAQEQQAFADIRDAIASKEVRSNMAYWQSIQSLEKQKIQSLENESRARERQFQENKRITAAMQSLGNQREAAYAAEAKAAEQAAREAAAAEERRYREAERKSDAITALHRQREAAYAAEAKAVEQAAREAAAAEERRYREAERKSDAITALHRQREAAYAAEAKAAEQAAREVAAAEERRYREAERKSDAITALHRQREAAYAAEARETQALESQYRRLSASLDPLVAAQQRFDNAMDIVNRSLAEGVISTQEHRRAVQALRNEMEMAGYAMNQFGVVVGGRGRTAIRASRDAFQQLGYQVGDFAVQLQYGTPFLIAFAQQGSQLLQVFGPWGAILGAALASTAALMTGFSNASKDTEELEKDIVELSDVVRILNETQRTTASDFERNLQATFEDSATSVGLLVQRIRELEFLSIVDPIRGALDEITIGIDRVDIALERVIALNRLKATGETLSVVQQSIYDDAVALVQQNLATAASYDQIKESLRGISEARTAEDLIVAFSDSLQLAERMNDTIGNELAASLVQAAREAGLYDEIMSRINDSTSDFASETERVLGNLQAIASVLDGIQGRIDSLSVSNISAQAQLAALQAGAPAEVATMQGEIAAEQARLAPALGSEDAIIRQAASAELQEFVQLKEEELALESEISRILEERRSAEKGSSGSAAAIDEALREAQRLFEDTRTEAEKYANEIDRINRLHQLFPEIVTEDVVERALKDLKEGLSEVDQTAKNLEKTFSDTMVSIITGSESAGEAVSRLLLTLAEMALSSAFQSFFSGAFDPISWLFTPSANGNVFYGGSVVPYQQGGIVNGASYFPMTNGSTGLMGEAGPEAIMPLSRDASGRLGVKSENKSQHIVLEVIAEEGEMFVPRIRQISGDVAVRVTSASARAQNTSLGARMSEFDERGTI
jgi:hypothetical protein